MINATYRCTSCEAMALPDQPLPHHPYCPALAHGAENLHYTPSSMIQDGESGAWYGSWEGGYTVTRKLKIA